MPCWPVMYQDGIYQVTDRDGIAYPILMAGAPVRQLDPGWYPTGLQTGLPPFHLLELRNDADRNDAVWYLNEELEFVTHTSGNFREQDTDKLVAGLSPLLGDIDAISIRAPLPGIAPSSHGFDGINPIFLPDLIGVVVNAAFTLPDVVLTDSLHSISEHYTAGGLQLSTSMLGHSLELTLPAAAGDIPVLASPFDQRPLQAQEDYAPERSIMARMLRFHDAAAGVTMYLAFRHGGPAALYIPAMNTIFTRQDPFSGAAMLTTLFSYYAANTARTLPGAQGPEPELEPVYQPEPPPPDLPPDLPSNWWQRVFGLGHP